jgi:hypothetical protein
MTAELLNELLSTPVGPKRPKHRDRVEDFTNAIEIVGDLLTATLRDRSGVVNEGRALKYIEDEGQDPAKWEVVSWYKVEYGPLDPVFKNGEPVLDDEGEVVTKPRMESVKFTFRRRTEAEEAAEIPLDDLLAGIKQYRPVRTLPTGDHGFLVLLGDMQFGKMDGDGPEGTVQRTIECINKAADALLRFRLMGYDIGHIHIAWLGDHVEGFVSQGGATAWRTRLTLTEQIRLTRRVMQHALLTFAPLAEKLTMAAVPGNHGETVRFAGKGITRYDDSHDTESLIANADAVALAPEKFSHVQFLVPDNDQLTIVTEVAGTVIAHAHGHQWTKGKHIQWWQEQAFRPGSIFHDAHLLVAGHNHQEFVDTWDHRLFLQVPALESESTWYKNRRGPQGAPGLVVAVTKDGATDLRQVIR